MKIKILPVALLSFILLSISTGSVLAEEKKADELKSEKDKLSYAIGANIAQSIASIKEEIDFDKVVKGISDQFHGKALLLSEQETISILSDFSAKMQKKMMEESQVAAQKNTTEGAAYLKENKEKKGVVTTESGLQYTVVKKGDGPVPTATDTVKVHYKGTTIDGSEFDSSYKRGEPAVFPVTGVIKGWTEALTLMTVGSTYKLVIPSDLAYGAQGAGAKIGPNSVLVFDVELLGIEK